MSQIETATTRISLPKARVVTPQAVLSNGRVVVEDDRIVAVDGGERTNGSPEGAERLVLPGFVDLHGDDIERHIFPRTDARVDLDRAVLTCDRANVAAGITTKYHAVAFETVPEENRTVELATEILEAVATAAEPLAEHRVNARCEVGDPTAVDAVTGIIDRDVVGLVSLMNHVSGKGQFRDDGAFRRRYADDGARRLAECRRSVDPADDRTASVIDAARDAGVPVASHDDEDPRSVVSRYRQGVDICEYPTTIEAARCASRLGMVTAMGAPNLVRGGSLWGNLSAREAIEAGVVSALCTDYHPPSLLAAVFADPDERLPDRVARVTKRPADAVGLTDRGRIEVGARADLIVVDPSPTPTVERALVAGEEVYRARV